MTSHQPCETFAFGPDDALGQYLNRYPQSLDWFRERGIGLGDHSRALGELLPAPEQDLLELALVVGCAEASDDVDVDVDQLCGSMTIDELVDHLCTIHHLPTRAELGRLGRIAAALDGDAAPVPDWYQRFTRLRHELIDHLDEEEALLFPACRALELSLAGRPISTEACNRELSVMEHGHREVLHELELLLRALEPPQWPVAQRSLAAALLSGLRALHADLLLHSYKEEEYLLPAAIHADELYDARQRARTGLQPPPAED